MTYSLYEMQPISYDLYMATFGRSNYTQSGVQTFDDGITEEVQTDEVSVTQKWTQCPVEFSKNDIYQHKNAMARKYSKHTEDYLTKFTFLIKDNCDEQNDGEMKSDENYKDNPLRVFLEQKDGVGGDEMLPYETYKSKLKSNDYSSKRLSKFLKRFESKVSCILSKNTGAKDLAGLEKSKSKLSFTKGHVAISPKSIENSKYFFLKSSKITKVIFSETKSNLIMTVHKKAKGVDGKKCLVCLWDLSVAREPRKTLLVIADIAVGRFRGNTDGIFVAALEDGYVFLTKVFLWLRLHIRIGYYIKLYVCVILIFFLSSNCSVFTDPYTFGICLKSRHGATMLPVEGNLLRLWQLKKGSRKSIRTESGII